MRVLTNSRIKLEQYFRKIQQAEWTEQLTLIKQITINQQVCQLLQYHKYQIIILQLFKNPISKLIAVLCQFITQIFEFSVGHLYQFATQLISSQYLLGMLGSNNKVRNRSKQIISNLANELIKSIILCIICMKTHKKLGFISNLQYQFLNNSKNIHIREQISMYITVVIENGYKFEKIHNIIEKGMKDSSAIVRKNIKIISQMVKEKQKNYLQNRQNKKIIGKQNKKQYKQIIKNININNSSIICKSISNDSIQDKQSINQNDINFYLNQLNSNEIWGIKLSAFQALCIIIDKFDDKKIEQHLKNLMNCLIPLLSQRRNKIYQQVCSILVYIFQTMGDNKILKQNIETNWNILLFHIVKQSSVCSTMIPILIQNNPQNLIKIAQLSICVKSLKQQHQLLNIIYNELEKIMKNYLKIKILVEIMCYHIDKNILKDKQISLVALKILILLKQKYQQQVLNELMIQSSQKLKKILRITQQYSPELKQKILQRTNKQNLLIRMKHKIIIDEIVIKIEEEITKIYNNQDYQFIILAQIFIKNQQKINSKHYKMVLEIIKILTNYNQIMEFQVMINNMVVIHQKIIFITIIQLISQQQSNNIEIVYQLFYLRIINLCMEKIQYQFNMEQYIRQLRDYYRRSEAVQIRQKIILVLTKIKKQQLVMCMNNEQLKLIEQYQSN